MMRTTLLAVLLGFSATIHGWILDASCDPYRDMILSGMKSAFSLADISYDTFARLPRARDEPANQARRELVGYMFADALKNGNIDPDDENWLSAMNKFGRVLDYDETKDGMPKPAPAAGYPSLGSNNFVMYCNYTRFRENENCAGQKVKGVVCDTSMKRAFEMDKNYSKCKGGWLSSGSVQAWTRLWSRPSPPGVIQLCPDYLKEVKSHEYQTLDDQAKEHGLARAIKKVSKWLDDPMRTPMDVVATFDATLLHEMTHALPGDGEATVDENGGDSYGWKKCHKLRHIGTKNADSYSMFAIGAKMISERGERPMEDGTIQVLPQPGKKRDLLLDANFSPLEGRAPDPDTTLTLDHPAVTLDPSDAATLDNGALPTDGSAVIYDVHTVFFPKPSESQGEPGNPNPASSSSSNPPSTFRTSTRGSDVANLSSSGAMGRPSSSKPLPDPTSDSSIPPASTGDHPGASSGVPGSSSGVLSGTPSSGSPSGLSSSGLPSSKLPPASSLPPESPSSESPLPGSSSSSRITAVIISTTDGGPAPSMSGSAGVSSNQITPAPSSNAVKTVTSGSSTSEVPMTVVNVSKDGTTTPVTYISTYTSSEGIEPTGAWMCTGPLCDNNSDCKVPLFCSSDDDDISGSWGLLDGWGPPAPPDGGPPPVGGPPAPPPEGPTPPSGGGEGNPDGDDRKDDSTSTESSSSATSSSSASSSSSSASSSSSEVIDPAPTGDTFLAGDPKADSWYEMQQSVLSAAFADTTDPYITWTPTASSSKPVVPVSSPNPSSSTPASSSSKPEETPAETTSEEEPEPTSTEETDAESTEPAPPSSSTPRITSPASSPTAPNDAPDASVTPSSPPVTPKNEPTTKYMDEYWGEVLEYPSQTVSSVSVNGMTISHLKPAGEPTTLQTPMPSATSVDNNGNAMCRDLTTALCAEAFDKFRYNAMNSDDRFELLPGSTDHYSHKVFSVFWNYQCRASLKCPDDHPGMSGLQAYRAFDEMFSQHDEPVDKCGHYKLDNGCFVVTDYHSTI